MRRISSQASTPSTPHTPLSASPNKSLDDLHRTIRSSLDYAKVQSIRFPALSVYADAGVVHIDDIMKLMPSERQTLFRKTYGLNWDTTMAFTHYFQNRQRHFISYVHVLSTCDISSGHSPVWPVVRKRGKEFELLYFILS